MTNFEVLIETVNKLAQSQGYYSRLKAELNSADDYTLEQYKTQINELPKWNNPVDVIMYLER